MLSDDLVKRLRVIADTGPLFYKDATKTNPLFDAMLNYQEALKRSKEHPRAALQAVVTHNLDKAAEGIADALDTAIMAGRPAEFGYETLRDEVRAEVAAARAAREAEARHLCYQAVGR